MLLTIAALLFSYLLGSIPTAYLFGKMLKGIDIRKIGSGNVGATNAMRALGKGPGVTVLLLDILKGFAAVIFLADYFTARSGLLQAQNFRLLMGLSCICGHNWSIFLQFKGGKGIAATFGVLLGLSLKIPGLNILIGLIILTWVIVFISFRMVSLASISSAIALPILSFCFKQPFSFILASLLLCVFVLIRHRTNLQRILQGKEPRLYFKKPAD